MSGTNTNHIEARGRAGDYSDLILPLDYLILEQLTPEGTTMSGLYPIGSSTKAIEKGLQGAIAGSAISARIRIMNMLGLAIKVKSLGQGNHAAAWQRSVKAEELLKKWKEGQDA